MSFPSDPRFFLVMNPSSRSFQSRFAWPKIFEGLKKRKIFYDFAITEKDRDSGEIARAAVKKGFDAVIAVGGDGTINDVINGLFSSDSEKAGAAFGVLYTGTSPDFCRNHLISLDIEKALDLLTSGSKVFVDVCRISHRVAPDGTCTHRVFSCCANIGLGAAVARGANSGLRKKFGDFWGTLFSIFQAVIRYPSPTFRVQIDGEEKIFPRMFDMFVGKGRFVASGIKLNIDITPDDGRMFVLPLFGLSKFRLLSLLPMIYSGSITRRFAPFFAKRVEICECLECNEVEYDGDPRGFLPATIEILPRSLQLFRPPIQKNRSS